MRLKEPLEERAGSGGPPTGPDRRHVHHHFTVDVEEYFQVAALAPVVGRDRWDRLERRAVQSTHALLQLLDRHGVKATFFTLGWIAEREPDLIRTIVASGHELASHGWGHRKVTDLTPDAFRDSIRTSKALLEDVAGVRVGGYRAPSFSIVRGREWALDILIEEGYRYDSSLFPIRRPGYGYQGGRPDPHTLKRSGGSLREYPPATLQIAGARLPAGGGGYLRLLPYSLVAAGLRQSERRGAPGTFYIHPWELDPDQPRFTVPLRTRMRHYGGLRRTAGRLDRLLSEFRFRSIAESEAEKESVNP